MLGGEEVKGHCLQVAPIAWIITIALVHLCKVLVGSKPILTSLCVQLLCKIRVRAMRAATIRRNNSCIITKLQALTATKKVGKFNKQLVKVSRIRNLKVTTSKSAIMNRKANKSFIAYLKAHQWSSLKPRHGLLTISKLSRQAPLKLTMN